MYSVLFSIFAVVFVCIFFAVNVVVALLGAYFLSPGNITVTVYVPPWTLLIVIVFCPFLRYIVSVWLFIMSVASPATSPFGDSVMFRSSVSPALMSVALIVRFVWNLFTLNMAFALDDS